MDTAKSIVDQIFSDDHSWCPIFSAFAAAVVVYGWLILNQPSALSITRTSSRSTVQSPLDCLSPALSLIGTQVNRGESQQSKTLLVTAKSLFVQYVHP